MPDTYGQIWRKLQLWVPGAPALLIQEFVKAAYKKACDERNWSFLLAESEFMLNAQKSGVAILTNGDATVQGAGGSTGITFASTDAGRQMKFGGGPPITLISVDLTGNTSAELERPWAGLSDTAAGIVVQDCYVTCPEDFGHFKYVLDPQMQRQVSIYQTWAELNAADPGRMNTGNPWALVNYRLSTLAATAGRVQYEFWPYWGGGTTQRYPYLYVKRPATPADDDYLLGPWGQREDVMLLGARAEAAEWPGTENKPNPYFNLNLARSLRDQFKEQLGLLEVKDEETYLTWWVTHRMGRFGMNSLAPNDARFIQEHE